MTALNYPAPIFIRWGTPEAEDPYVQHLAKVQGVLEYLATLNKKNDDDLVLIIDGYDILFQLGPDVLLKRYFGVIQDQNKQLLERFGKSLQDEYDIRQSIIVGADKISWPDDFTLPSSWAVPDSTLPRYAFGPQTDTGHWRHHNRPRWLNSGTIMGPIGEVRALFAATLEKIHFDHTTDSDQFYFAQVFAEQSYARTLLVDGPPPNRSRQVFHAGYFAGVGFDETVTIKLPILEPGQTTEYHITLDYESALFQTSAYYHQYLGWRKHNFADGIEQKTMGKGESTNGFPADILSSPSPFPDGWPGDEQSQSRSKAAVSWRDLPLGVNAASGRIFALMHYTPPKELRDVWYPRHWFFPYGESIMRRALGAAISSSSDSAGTYSNTTYITTIGDRDWHAYKPQEPKSATPGLRVGGGFTETGAYQSWVSLCSKHEQSVFHNVPESGERPWPYLLKPTSSSLNISASTTSLTSLSTDSVTPSTTALPTDSTTARTSDSTSRPAEEEAP